MANLELDKQLEKMRTDWDERARENARYYVSTGKKDWTDEEFFRSGEQTVSEEILTDMINICQGKDPKQMRVLEIGCGAGRITRALAGRPNAFIDQNNGKDLSILGDRVFDFAFSTIVFQHIPSYAIIESYVREVHRLLRPGALFKFQVQGDASLTTDPDDTWFGVPFSDEAAVTMAERCGFEPRHRHGAGEQYFWLWYFKK